MAERTATTGNKPHVEDDTSLYTMYMNIVIYDILYVDLDNELYYRYLIFPANETNYPQRQHRCPVSLHE